jgi:transcriptional regulator with XRE-family HTH domain
MSLRTYLRQKLKERGWTQADLAAYSGINKMNITRLMGSGKERTQVPDLATLDAYARALEVPLYRLIEEAGYEVHCPRDNPEAILARQIIDRPLLREICNEMIMLDEKDHQQIRSFIRGLKASQ